MSSQSSEPHNETKRTIHSKAYERGKALLFVLGTVAALVAVVYLIPD